MLQRLGRDAAVPKLPKMPLASRHKLRVRESILLPGMMLLFACASTAFAAERPSFMQTGDVFCTNETDFDGFATHGRIRTETVMESCRRMTAPVRVVILSGQAGVKTMVRLANGPDAYAVGWTNGTLPLQ